MPRRSAEAVPRGRAAVPWSGVRAFAYGAALLLAGPSLVDLAHGVTPDANGCRLVKVIDGDTLVLACDGFGVFRARLVGFDTPEIFTPAMAEKKLMTPPPCAGSNARPTLRSRTSSFPRMPFTMAWEWSQPTVF